MFWFALGFATGFASVAGPVVIHLWRLGDELVGPQ